SYEEHALKKLKKQEQSTSVVDPLAYLVKTTHQQAPTHSTTTSPSQLTPTLASTLSFTAQSHDDAISGHHPTQGLMLRCMMDKSLLNRFRDELQCKEPKRPKDSLWHHDKAMLLQAKKNGAVLDAKAEAFLADVECTILLAEPLALTTTNMFQINEVRIFNDNIFETVSPSVPSEVPQDEHLDSDDDSEQALVNATLSVELDQCKLELTRLERNKVKLECDQPTLYDGHRLLQPGHAPVTVSDSHETLLETEVSRMKMSQKPRHVTPVDYTKLNALYDQFVPQKKLSREQVYWLSASDIASQSSDPLKPVTPFVHTRPVNSEVYWLSASDIASQSSDPPKPVTLFVHTRPVNSEVHTKVWKIKECLTPFEEVIKKRTAPPSDVLYHRSPIGSSDKNALETEITQLKDNITSLRIQNDGSTQKPPVQHKKPTIPVNMFPKAKPATEARKPIPKRNTQNHNPLPAKSVKARRAVDYYRNLYVDISQFVDRSTKSVHTKPHQVKHVVNTSTNAWNATKNTVTRIVPIWKPRKPPVQHKKPTISVNMFPKAKPATEARKTIPKRNTQNHNPLPAKSVKARRAADYYKNLRFNLHDIFGSRTSTKPIVKPSELTPCVSPSTNATLSLEPILEPIELSLSVSSCASSTITMVSRFFEYRLSDRKAGSNGISSIFY
nr:hypothetical protein [Tanacetum cinerariifolium]